MRNGWRKSASRDLLLALLLLPAAAVGGFGPFLSGPFLYDDLHTLRDNPALHRLDPLFFFTHPSSASRIPATLTRPLLTFSYALDFHRAGPDPRSFRLTNILLHLANAFLVYGLTRKTRNLRAFALPSAFLFLLLPLHSINIAYLSSRSTLLSSTFYLGGLLAFARAWDLPARRRRPLAFSLTILCYAAGLLSKESAATLPAAVLLWAFLFPPAPAGGSAEPPLSSGRGKPAGSKKTLPPPPEAALANGRFLLLAPAALFAVFGLFLLYRLVVSAPVLFPPARPRPVWQYLAAELPVYWTYLRLMLWPVHLSLEHETWVPASPSALISPSFLLSALALSGLIFIAVKFRRSAPEPAFSALFFVLYLLPASSVIPLTLLINENRPYLSSLFYIWSLLWWFRFIRNQWPRLAFGLISALPVFFLLLVRQRAGVYAAEISAWQDAVKNAPRLSRAHVNLGAAYLVYRQDFAAKAEFEWALRLDPCSAPALVNLGNLASRAGDWKSAEAFYRRALACDPASVPALLNLADLLQDSGRPDQAIPCLEAAEKIWPGHSEVLGRLALWHADHGDAAAARRYFQLALRNAASPAEAEKWRALFNRRPVPR